MREGVGVTAHPSHVQARGRSPSPVTTVRRVNDPSYINPDVWQHARDLAARLLDQESEEDTYWRGTELQGLLGQHLLDEHVDRLYILWAELTDIWELDLSKRPKSVELMGEAAQDFLALDNAFESLDAYLLRWEERLRQV